MAFFETVRIRLSWVCVTVLRGLEDRSGVSSDMCSGFDGGVTLVRNTAMCKGCLMTDTLTIRLEQAHRDVVELAARAGGLGLSGYVSSLAEAEAARLRREMIRADGDRVVCYLLENPRAKAELDVYSVPQAKLP
jgi:uncharacterized protein (DUF1778 family)